MCWSPKGKQMLVGRSGGSFTQYDPKLTAKKNVAAPTNIFHGGPVSGWSSNSILEDFWIIRAF